MTVAARATHVPTSSFTLTFPRQLRSEYIKLTTVRGTWWSVAIVAALTMGIAFLATLTMTAPADTIMAVVMPVQFTMMLAGILGVISVTGEYSTGMIRSTLTANPVRGSVLAAKATVLAFFMFVVSLLIFLATAAMISPLAASSGIPLLWDDPGKTILPILAASGAMALFALLGVGLGFLLRSGAGAIAMTVGILFVLPIIVALLGSFAQDIEWIGNLGNYLPASAAQNAILPQDGWGLSAPEAWATLIAWPAAALLGAWAVVRGRDV
ncbi:putative integral membrane protein [Microbacterium esteraromaticum]|uniref:Putative integral membrane protein n=1 Tax=Microbacterium esteraromaticum TaxID=57043 RepID=A0A1R4IAQ4_9MICO|nr:ABC transporter permease subunit [Microbacterium esteraromaticum]SJN16902.1 putative integral membrane protein [Microbacterium esteraromaticum]